MLDPNSLRERAAQMVLKEARYRFPMWIRCALVGFALGVTTATVFCHIFQRVEPIASEAP